MPRPRKPSRSRPRSSPRSRGPRRPPGVDLWLNRRRTTTFAGTVAAVVLVLLLAVLDRRGLLLHGRGDLRTFEGQTFTVHRVVDGDTLILDHRAEDGERTRVRLWGIDAPETAKPALHEEAEPFADDATALLRDLTEGLPVTLTLQDHRVRDSYGRLLAYVARADGRVANEELVRAGLARADDRWPHRDAVKYAMLQQQAKVDGVGIWRRKKPAAEGDGQ